jgi:prepilin-type N-terminal cleavage/methylation domain-containing protein/prepilin-type processing-associated H-X9-DG protein
MKRRAFTLVELLVVIGIAAIIAAILWPVGGRCGERSRKSSCQNNLKQIVLGYKQYTNDFDERAPLVLVSSGSPSGKTPYGWADALQPYIRNTQVYQCPADTYEGNDDPTKIGYTDYWYNANFVGRWKGRLSGYDVLHTGAWAQIVVFGDGGNTTGAPTGDARYNQCGDGTSLTSTSQLCAMSPAGIANFPAAQIHLDGANFAYNDGHVKWLRGNTATQSAGVLNNGMTMQLISQAPNTGKATFSLLHK